MNRNLLIAAFGVMLAAGCATAPDPSIVAAANAPLLCKDKQQCDLYWSRAQAWIANNSSYRIQAVTDTLISTYGPIGPLYQNAYQIVRVVNADGSARITIQTMCMYGCRPAEEFGVASFKRYCIAGA